MAPGDGERAARATKGVVEECEMPSRRLPAPQLRLRAEDDPGRLLERFLPRLGLAEREPDVGESDALEGGHFGALTRGHGFDHPGRKAQPLRHPLRLALRHCPHPLRMPFGCTTPTSGAFIRTARAAEVEGGIRLWNRGGELFRRRKGGVESGSAC